MGMIRCRSCGGEMAPLYEACPLCGTDATLSNTPGTITCWRCASEIADDHGRCPVCGENPKEVPNVLQQFLKDPLDLDKYRWHSVGWWVVHIVITIVVLLVIAYFGWYHTQ